MYSILLQQQGANWTSMLFMVAIIAVFYFFMIRPQQKKAKEQKKFIEEIKKGEDVVTIAGIYGRVAEIEGDAVIWKSNVAGESKCPKAGISMGLQQKQLLEKNRITVM